MRIPSSVVVLTAAAAVALLAGCDSTRKSDDLPKSDPDALYNTIVLDATTTGLGEYVAQTMGGGRLANQYMPLVRIVPVDSLAAAESTVVRETRAGKASGYLVIDSASVRAKSARYWGKRAKVKEEMELVRGAVRENALALELRNRGMPREQVDSMTAWPVDLKIEEAR
jgi:hypothetical protein